MTAASAGDAGDDELAARTQFPVQGLGIADLDGVPAQRPRHGGQVQALGGAEDPLEGVRIFGRALFEGGEDGACIRVDPLGLGRPALGAPWYPKEPADARRMGNGAE